MSEVKSNSHAKVWAPPVFPMGGRLPGDVVTVTANYKKRTAEEHDHQKGVNSKGRSHGFECCHSLLISLFFDGTNNNELNGTKKNRAAFEQRSCFPLDSIRKEDGRYLLHSYEVVYPGVHSDVGGGCPQNDRDMAQVFLRSSGCMGKRPGRLFPMQPKIK
jgi:hypothetical protein